MAFRTILGRWKLLGALTSLMACTGTPAEQAATAPTAAASRPPSLRPASPDTTRANQAASAVTLPATLLATRQVGTAALRGSLAGAQADTVQGRYLQITAPDSLPRLLYRTSPRDTVWTELLLEAPDNIDQGAAATQSTIAFSLDNLDQRGQPELLVTVCQSDVGGNAGREDWCWVNLIDISHTPRLLLCAGTSSESEAYGGYAQLHGATPNPEEAVQGCTRRISLHQHELLIGPVKTQGSQGAADCPLGKLPAGRYRYQQGRLYRVGK